MNIGRISKRYAKALLGYAKEQHAEDQVYREMKKLASVFALEPRLRMALDNPILTIADKLQLMQAAVGTTCSPQFIRFVELTLKHKREIHLQRIALSYQDLYCKQKQINTAKLITASAVDTALVEKMKLVLQTIKPGTLQLETNIDPRIEGGFVLFIDTYRLDASVATQLKRIKQQFIVENSKMV